MSFKSVQKKIAKSEGVSKAPAAKRKNPKLERVKG